MPNMLGDLGTITSTVTVFPSFDIATWLGQQQPDAFEGDLLLA